MRQGMVICVSSLVVAIGGSSLLVAEIPGPGCNLIEVGVESCPESPMTECNAIKGRYGCTATPTQASCTEFPGDIFVLRCEFDS